MSGRVDASEHQEQAATVAWFRTQYPRHKIIAIPNGTHLAGDERARAIKMRKLKEAGLEPGAADLFVAVPTPHFRGLWIEMKSRTGRLSSDQADFGAHMRAVGYWWECCRGFDAARSFISNYMEMRLIR